MYFITELRSRQISKKGLRVGTIREPHSARHLACTECQGHFILLLRQGILKLSMRFEVTLVYYMNSLTSLLKFEEQLR